MGSVKFPVARATRIVDLVASAEEWVSSVMIRFLVRVIGVLLVAAGFVGIVVDGTRSIANHELVFAPLGEVMFALFPQSFPMLEPAITRHVSPVLWDPILLTILLWPASLVAFVLGALLIWLSQKPAEPVGYLTER